MCIAVAIGDIFVGLLELKWMFVCFFKTENFENNLTNSSICGDTAIYYHTSFFVCVINKKLM